MYLQNVPEWDQGIILAINQNKNNIPPYTLDREYFEFTKMA